MTISKLKQSGFTLVEAIIFIAIFSIILVAVINVAVNASVARNKNYVASEVHQNARVILDFLSQRIRAANGVNIGASTFNTNPGVLSLSMATAGVNPTIFDRDSSSQGLRITEGVSSPLIITTNTVKLTKLVFKNVTGNSSRESIRIIITLEYANPSDPQFSYSYDFQTTVSLRQ